MAYRSDLKSCHGPTATVVGVPLLPKSGIHVEPVASWINTRSDDVMYYKLNRCKVGAL